MNNINVVEVCIIIGVCVLLIFILISTREKLLGEKFIESYHSPTECVGWIKLYETFNYTGNPPDARSWYWYQTVNSKDKNGYTIVRKQLRMNLKSFDINVPTTGKGVEIWALYQESPIASTKDTGVTTDVYADPDYLYKANPGKYRLVTKCYPGQRIRGVVDFPAHRIMVKGAF